MQLLRTQRSRLAITAATCAIAAAGLVALASPASADTSITHVVQFVIPAGGSVGDSDVQVKDCSIVSCHELLTYYSANTMTLYPSVDPAYAAQDYAEYGAG